MTSKRENDETSEILASIDPPRNFQISTEDRIRAMAQGAPAYAVRKRRIEDAELRYKRSLVELRDALTIAGATPARISEKLTERARKFNLASTNKLIDAHNRYYPIEARLPIDPKSGHYLLFGNPWTKERELTVEALVATALEDP